MVSSLALSGAASISAEPQRATLDFVEHLAEAAMDAAERGSFEEAERLSRRASAMAGRLPTLRDRHDGKARALRPLGTAQRAVGRYRDAQRTFERALTHAVRSFGAASVQAAELHNDLGMTFKYAGRFADAEAAYARAQGILETLPDADAEDVAALYHNLAGLAHLRGDFRTAEPLTLRGIEIRSKAIGDRAPATLLDRSAHAAILVGLGRTREAEASIRDLLPDLEAAFGSDHPEVAVALNNLAAIVQVNGDLTGAEALYRRVVAIKAARLGRHSPALAVAINNLGTVLRAQGRAAAAAAEYRRALGLLEGAVDEDHPNLQAIRRNLARLEGPPS